MQSSIFNILIFFNLEKPGNPIFQPGKTWKSSFYAEKKTGNGHLLTWKNLEKPGNETQMDSGHPVLHGKVKY